MEVSAPSVSGQLNLTVDFSSKGIGPLCTSTLAISVNTEKWNDTGFQADITQMITQPGVWQIITKSSKISVCLFNDTISNETL
jgi:hypothetical protein